MFLPPDIEMSVETSIHACYRLSDLCTFTQTLKLSVHVSYDNLLTSPYNYVLLRYSVQ